MAISVPSRIDKNLPAYHAQATAAMFRGQFLNAALDIEDLWNSVTDLQKTSAKYIKVSSFGTPNGSDDTATLQAAFDAAIAADRKLIIDGPLGQDTEWILKSTLSDSQGKLMTPRVISINASTGLITLDQDPKWLTGDSMGLVGMRVGSGGGLTQIDMKTQFFWSKVTSTTGYLYNSRSNAKTQGGTGKYIPSNGIETQGTFNYITTTTSIASGNTTVTVLDASKLIVGDKFNAGGNNSSNFYTISNIAGNDLTFTPAYSGTTINSGAQLITTSLDVVSLLNFVQGTSIWCGTVGVSADPATSNNSSIPLVKSVSGNTLHLTLPPNTFLPTPGNSQTIRMGVWVDPKYIKREFEIIGSPRVRLRKHDSFSGNEMIRVLYGSWIKFTGLEIWGKTYGPNYEYLGGNIVPGDDGIRVFGCAGALFEHCIFRNFGDSALRCHTSSFWVGAKNAIDPTAGVYSDNIIVRNCKFYDCFQLSTTNSGSDYQGGSARVIFCDNLFDGIGGSVKFANRAPGGMRCVLQRNLVKNVGRDGFELDSMDDYIIEDNFFEDVARFDVFVIANNLQPVGFEFNRLKVRKNQSRAGTRKQNSTSSGGIYLATDSYPDATLWDFKGLEFDDNEFYDYPAQAYPIQIANGSYVNPVISRNKMYNCASVRMIAVTPRISGIENHWQFIANIAHGCVGTSATLIYFIPSNGAQGTYMKGVELLDNVLDSTLTTNTGISNVSYLFQGDYIAGLTAKRNRWKGPGNTAISNQNYGANFVIEGNDFYSTGTGFGSCIALNGVDGVKIRYNTRLKNSYSGTSVINLDRKCQDAKIFANDYDGSAGSSLSVNNIPIKSSLDSLRREDYVSSSPSSGTWEAGDRFWFTAPAANTSPGSICTVAGSYSSLGGITGDSVNGSPNITNLSGTTNLAVGTRLTHAGFSGTRKVIAILSNTSVQLDANAGSDQTAATLAVANPTFKAMANIAA